MKNKLPWSKFMVLDPEDGEDVGNVAETLEEAQAAAELYLKNVDEKSEVVIFKMVRLVRATPETKYTIEEVK